MIPLHEGMFWELSGNFNAGWVVLILKKPLTFHSTCSASVKERIEVLNLPVILQNCTFLLRETVRFGVHRLPSLLQEPHEGRDCDTHLSISKCWYGSWHTAAPSCSPKGGLKLFAMQKKEKEINVQRWALWGPRKSVCSKIKRRCLLLRGEQEEAFSLPLFSSWGVTSRRAEGNSWNR